MGKRTLGAILGSPAIDSRLKSSSAKLNERSGVVEVNDMKECVGAMVLNLVDNEAIKICSKAGYYE